MSYKHFLHCAQHRGLRNLQTRLFVETPFKAEINLQGRYPSPFLHRVATRASDTR